MKEYDEIDDGQILKYQIKREREEIILIRAGTCNKWKSTCTEIVPCYQVIVVNDCIIECVGKYVMPISDISLVEW
jgi:hypothetical protein